MTRCLCVHQDTVEPNVEIPDNRPLAAGFQEHLVNSRALPVAVSSIMDPEIVHQLLRKKHLGSLMAILS